jgi:hypothetical protein
MASSTTAGKRADLPYQMEVYFASYPTLDLEALARFVTSCEPSQEPCEVQEVGDEDKKDKEPVMRVGGFVASQGNMHIGVLIHDTQTPLEEAMSHSGLPPATQQQFLANQAWALLTQVGGDDTPVERVLFLYKVAAGLCLQGAIGIVNLGINRWFPGSVLTQMFGGALQNAEGSIWDALRTEGEPVAMLAAIVPVEVLGRRFLATRGFGQCGLPDFLWEYTTAEEAQEVTNLFRNCFSYLLPRGPVIKAGHTMGYDQNVAFRFTAPPAGAELPYPTGEVLLVTKERRS